MPPNHQELEQLLTQCRLLTYKIALVQYGFECVEDFTDERIDVGAQLKECGLKRAQALRLVAHAKAFTNEVTRTSPGRGAKHPAGADIPPITTAPPHPHAHPHPHPHPHARSLTPPLSANRSVRGSHVADLSPSASSGAGTLHSTDSHAREHTNTNTERPKSVPLQKSGALDPTDILDDLPHDEDANIDASTQRVSNAPPSAAHQLPETDHHHPATTQGSAIPVRVYGSDGDASDDMSAFWYDAVSEGSVGASPLLGVPPELPGIDAHIRNDSLRYEVMTAELRKARGKFLKRSPKRRARKETSSVSQAGGFTIQEIKHVVRYIDNMNDDGERDGQIDAIELEAAFRRARRARAGQRYEELGRGVVHKLEHLMKLQKLTPDEWFEQMDAQAGTQSDGRVTHLELKEGLREMTKGKIYRQYRFPEDEVANLLRYMDPNGDGTLDVDEVNDAIRRAHLDVTAAAVEQEAGAIMTKLEEFMDENNMRIIDLFNKLDLDKSGEITIGELKQGLIDLAAPSAEDRARLKREKDRKAVMASLEEQRAKREAELRRRMERAKATGAFKVLTKLDAHMRQKNMRVKDLFSKSGFDASGDGLLDHQEFAAALKAIGIDFSNTETKVLIKFLDDSGDGQIEAYELEAALRRLHKDLASLKQKQQDAVDVHTVAMSRSLPSLGGSSTTKRSLNGKSGHPKVKVFSGSVFDSNWLDSFDSRMDLHLSRAFNRV